MENAGIFVDEWDGKGVQEVRIVSEKGGRI